MLRRRAFVVTIVLSAVTLVGCMAKSGPSPTSPPPSADGLEMIRSNYKAVFPKAVVGVVTAVLTEEPYAYVGQIDTAAIRASDVVTFLDADETPVANGDVIKVEAEGLTVRFVTRTRAPRVGDAAIKF